MDCTSPSIPGADTFLYWSKERFGDKAVITVTHVILTHGDESTRPVLLMVGIQVFATHYLDASLSVTAFVREAPSSAAYFVYVQKSEVDLLAGFWGALARSLIEARIRKDGPTILRRVATRMSSGEPAASRATPTSPRR